MGEVEHDVSDRKSEYKRRPDIYNQETRRRDLLLEQKRRREDTLNESRNLDIRYIDFSDELEECQLKPRKRLQLMLSEWMQHVPENLATNWSFVLCPVGKRCLVLSCEGVTRVYNKKGFKTCQFVSSLPKGSSLTALDCIRHGDTYYVLDVLYWKGQNLIDTEVSCRVFWMKSRFAERPPDPKIVPLEYHSCDSGTLSRVMCMDSSNSPPVDGLLFYHMDSHYCPGPISTPLVLWLKPYMLPEVLGITDLHLSYWDKRPTDYTDAATFIARYETNRANKRTSQRRWRRKKRARDVDMTEEDVVQETIELEEQTIDIDEQSETDNLDVVG